MPAGPPMYTLVDMRTGLQPILISLWAEHLRQTVRPNTAKSYLKDIKIFLGWCEEKKLDLGYKFSNLELPRPDELSNFIEEKIKYKNDGAEYKSSTINRRIVSTREFINFSFSRYLDWSKINSSQHNSACKALARLNKRTTQNMKSGAEVGLDEEATKEINPSELQIIRDILKPGSDNNPFRSKKIQLRNYCMFELSLECLLRRSEAVLLELSDFENTDNPTIRIKQPPLKLSMAAKDGASIKTKGRVMPIDVNLARWLQTYIEDSRIHFLKKGIITTALFLSEKTGRRISTTTANSYLKRVEEVYLKIHKKKILLHAHMLRVTGATMIRRGIESKLRSQEPMSSHVSTHELLRYAGGWGERSKEPGRYSKEAIIERIRQTRE